MGAGATALGSEHRAVEKDVRRPEKSTQRVRRNIIRHDPVGTRRRGCRMLLPLAYRVRHRAEAIQHLEKRTHKGRAGGGHGCCHRTHARLLGRLLAAHHRHGDGPDSRHPQRPGTENLLRRHQREPTRGRGGGQSSFGYQGRHRCGRRPRAPHAPAADIGQPCQYRPVRAERL